MHTLTTCDADFADKVHRETIFRKWIGPILDITSLALPIEWLSVLAFIERRPPRETWKLLPMSVGVRSFGFCTVLIAGSASQLEDRRLYPIVSSMLVCRAT
jgi:hypothetical protein